MDWVVKFCDKKIQEVINNSMNNFSNHMNCFEPEAFGMKREVVSNASIFTGKKRYIMNVLDKEGIRKQEMKIMGVEAIKSSTPKFCRNMMKKAFETILHGNEQELQRFIAETYRNFKSQNLNDIAFNRSVSFVNKYIDKNGKFIKGTPINSRASLVYNKLISEFKLEDKYPLIKDSEKIKYIFLKKGNPTDENVIAWNNTFPEEFNLNKWIDYDTQFQKSFIDSIDIIIKHINWSCEAKNDILDIF